MSRVFYSFSNPRPLLILSFILSMAVQAARAQEGLVALYTFQAGSGTTVEDVSGVGAPLNLTIGNAAAVDWLPAGGILIKQDVLITTPSGTPATKIISAAQASNELTVEAYVKPANLTQSGPARMVTVSADTGNRNFTLGQDQDQWAMRTRTPQTGNNGSGGPGTFLSPGGTASTDLHHVVFTRDAAGTETYYIDGQMVESRFVEGDFSGWNTAYRLALGGELNNQRYWHGEMHKVAIYSRALTGEEVMQLADDLKPKLEIADLSPFRGSHYHPAEAGITFRAVALANNTIAQGDIELVLNGEDKSSELQFAGSSANWEVSYMGLQPDQAYEGQILVKDNLGRTQIAALEFETFTLRADGLVALYTFEEGSGSIIQDRSESGPPLDLTIEDPSNVRWLAGGGLAIDSLVRIASAVPATKIMQPLEENNAITMEAWVRSAGPQSGPARVVTLSLFRGNFPGSELDNSLRNFTLGQDDNAYSFYLRTTETDEAGRPPLTTGELTVEQPAHLVFTRDPNGDARLYLNGIEVASGTASGDFSNWIEGYFLGIGTELNPITQAPADDRFRDWHGEMYRVAIYSRALSATEVTANFENLGGDDSDPPTVPQNLQSQSGAAFVRLSWDASTDDSPRPPYYEVERNGEIIATFLEETIFVDQSVSESSSYTYRVRSMDLGGNRSEFSTSAEITTGTLSEVTGLVRADFYTGISGTLIDDLRADPSFPDDPDQTMFLPSLETPLNWGNDYGVRVSGWFVAPETASYVFFIASDDQGEFWLSTDESEANLKRVAMEPEWNPHRDWTGLDRRDPVFGPENRTDTFFATGWEVFDPNTFQALISLEAGQSYYFEALMKEGGGRDHLSVTFKIANDPDPANGSPSRMHGDVIRTIGDPDFVPPVVVVSPQSQPVAMGESVTLNVELAEFSSKPVSYQWRFNGSDIEGATDSALTVSSFDLDSAGAYTVVVSNVAGTVESSPGILAPKGGLVALYTFQEEGGTVVRDVSGHGAPLDLTISDPSAVQWLAGGGLSLDSDVLISSSVAATKIMEAAQLSQALTVEAWVEPQNLSQSGPARIATFSVNTGNRNFTLGQQGDAWSMRTRTPVTGVNGTINPPGEFLSAAGTVDLGRLQHVVFTRDPGGEEVMYLDGVEMARRTVGGTFSNWDASYRFGLGNELSSDRPWLGQIHRVAVHSAALTAEEVQASFEAGADAPGPVIETPIIANHPQSQSVVIGESVTLSVALEDSGTGPYTYQWQLDGEDIPNATESTYTIPSFGVAHAGTYTVVVSNAAGDTPSLPAVLGPYGLMALYTFQEGEGNIVRDVSGAGMPLDLEISSLGSVEWITGGGLKVIAPVDIDSAVPATKIIQAAQASGELTIEAWVEPANLDQRGPARVVTVSENGSNRNFTLGQDTHSWVARVRTPVTGNNGSNPQFGGPSGSTANTAELRLQHVVFTRDSSLPMDIMYVDGVVVATRDSAGGDFSNWNSSYHLGLASELDAPDSRPWQGELHRVAIHSAALTAEEVQTSFQAGPRSSGAQLTLSNPLLTTSGFSFEFSTVAGTSYVVEYKDDLSQTTWTKLRVMSGDGSVQTALDSNPNASTRYYQVRTE